MPYCCAIAATCSPPTGRKLTNAHTRKAIENRTGPNSMMRGYSQRHACIRTNNTKQRFRQAPNLLANVACPRVEPDRDRHFFGWRGAPKYGRRRVPTDGILEFVINPSLMSEWTDGTIRLRSPVETDRPILIAGRDGEFQRFMGEGSPEPKPTAIVLSTAGEIVGWVAYDTNRSWLASAEANLGYNTFPEHRGNGFAKRAVLLLVAFLSEDSELKTATLLIDPANAPSLSVAQQTGFSPHGDIDGQLFFKRDLE